MPTPQRSRLLFAVLLLLAVPASAQDSPAPDVTDAEDQAVAPFTGTQVRVSVDTSSDSARLVITHTRSVSYVLSRQQNQLRLIYAESVRLDPPSMTVGHPLLERWTQLDASRVVFEAGPDFQRFETFELHNPFRLIIDLASDGAPDDRPIVLTTPTAGTVVVIDPGHGGIETGAVGPTGLREKDVALDLARRLRQRLALDPDVSVVLTRDADQILGLDERTAVANHNRADLFISIHLNSSRRRTAVGAETYYLSTEATDDEARTLAALENKAYQPGQTASDNEPDRQQALELILWDLAQNKYLAESSRLAESVQQRLNELTGTRNRGVRQAPFRVLMGATMPAILVEVGFVSNPDEEARLRSAEYQQRIVEALAGAVESFLRGREAIAAPTRRPGPPGTSGP